MPDSSTRIELTVTAHADSGVAVHGGRGAPAGFAHLPSYVNSVSNAAYEAAEIIQQLTAAENSRRK